MGRWKRRKTRCEYSQHVFRPSAPCLAPFLLMFVGVLQLELHIHDSNSLKEKRSVVNSILGRIRGRYEVSAAQLDTHEMWNRATLGIAMISNEAAAVHRVLNPIRDFVENDIRCDVIDCRIETL